MFRGADRGMKNHRPEQIEGPGQADYKKSVKKI